MYSPTNINITLSPSHHGCTNRPIISMLSRPRRQLLQQPSNNTSIGWLQAITRLDQLLWRMDRTIA